MTRREIARMRAVVDAARAWKHATDDGYDPRDPSAEQAVCDALYAAVEAYELPALDKEGQP